MHFLCCVFAAALQLVDATQQSSSSDWYRYIDTGMELCLFGSKIREYTFLRHFPSVKRCSVSFAWLLTRRRLKCCTTQYMHKPVFFSQAFMYCLIGSYVLFCCQLDWLWQNREMAQVIQAAQWYHKLHQKPVEALQNWACTTPFSFLWPFCCSKQLLSLLIGRDIYRGGSDNPGRATVLQAAPEANGGAAGWCLDARCPRVALCWAGGSIQAMDCATTAAHSAEEEVCTPWLLGCRVLLMRSLFLQSLDACCSWVAWFTVGWSEQAMDCAVTTAHVAQQEVWTWWHWKQKLTLPIRPKDACFVMELGCTASLSGMMLS